MNALNGRAALIHRVCLLGGALLLVSACERQSTVTRLQAIAEAEVTPTAVAEKIDAELSPRLLRRFSPLPKAPDKLDSDLIRRYEAFARSFTNIRAVDLKQQIDREYASGR